MPDGRHLVTEDRLQELAEASNAGGVVRLSAAELAQLLDHITTLSEVLLAELGAFCRVCGCTEHTPCEDGCWWVEADLCSSCAALLEEED